MLQRNLLSQSLWCNTDASSLIVIVHVRAVEARDKEGHCAPTEGTARMINDRSLNSQKKRWRQDKASAPAGAEPQKTSAEQKKRGGRSAQRGRDQRHQPRGCAARAGVLSAAVPAVLPLVLLAHATSPAPADLPAALLPLHGGQRVSAAQIIAH